MSDLGAGGVSASLILAALQDLVRATYAEVEAIKANLGQAASGDVAGVFPGPLSVVATHLAAPLPIIQGGSGNATGQPSGAAGGDLSGTYPNPVVSQVAGVAVAPAAWTPALQFGGAAVGITYGAQNGSVIQIGKLTVALFTIVLTSKGVSVGAATIAGLPIACGALAGAAVIASHAVMATANVFECAVSAGTTSIALGAGNAVASAALADTDFTNTTAISGVATYIAA